MRAFILGILASLSIAAGIVVAKADISTIPPEEQEKDRPSCKVVNSSTRISPKPWTKSNIEIDPDLNDTAVGYWLGPFLTRHTTGLHPTGNEKSIRLATLASETSLAKGRWRLTGRYAAEGAGDRKVTLLIFSGSVDGPSLSKPIVLGRSGNISASFNLPADGPVTLLLRSECHDFVCSGELNHLGFVKQ